MKSAKGNEIPSKMRALVLQKFDTDPVLQEMDVPLPGKGQVLVKMDSSPVNPSDISFLRGLYGSKKIPPVVPGFEGSGTVVATGDDWMSKRLLGKPVSCFSSMTGNGTWAEYMCTTSNFVVPLKKFVDIEQASMLLVNPLSAYAMVKMARESGHKAIINTAAASQLGNIMIRLCQEEGLEIVNVVRREEQVELLKKAGAKYVINSSGDSFQQELKEICKHLSIKLAFDAVAGDLTFDLVEAVAHGGEVIVYGGLSEKPSKVHPGKLIFESKKVSGFWLSEWIARQHILKLLGVFNKIQKYLSGTYSSSISKRASLENAVDAIKTYRENMTSGKVIVKPGEK